MLLRKNRRFLSWASWFPWEKLISKRTKKIKESMGGAEWGGGKRITLESEDCSFRLVLSPRIYHLGHISWHLWACFFSLVALLWGCKLRCMVLAWSLFTHTLLFEGQLHYHHHNEFLYLKAVLELVLLNSESSKSFPYCLVFLCVTLCVQELSG